MKSFKKFKSIFIFLIFGTIFFISCNLAFATTHSFVVKGKVEFYDEDIQRNAPLDRVKVRIYDSISGYDVYSLLKEVTTNKEGYYEATVTSTEDNGPDIFCKVLLDSDIVAISHAFLPDIIGINSSIHENQTSDVTIDVNFDQASNENGSAHVLSTIHKTFDWLGWPGMEKYVVEIATVWQENEAYFNHFLVPSAEILIGVDHRWSDKTINHEYGHAVMYSAYGDRLPWAGLLPPQLHDFYTESNPGFALNEGWAEFFAYNAPGFDYFDYYSSDFEWWKGNESPREWADNSGEIVEGALGKVWFQTGWNDVWNIIRASKPNNFKEFWDAVTIDANFFNACSSNNIIFSRGRIDSFSGGYTMNIGSDSVTLLGGKNLQVNVVASPLSASELHVTSTEEVNKYKLLYKTANLNDSNDDNYLSFTEIVQGASPLVFDISKLNDGAYDIVVSVLDENGFWDNFGPGYRGNDGPTKNSDEKIFKIWGTWKTIIIDKTPPDISISGVTDGATYTNPVTVTYTIKDKYLDTSSVTPNWGGTITTYDPDNIPNSGDEYIQITASQTFEAPGNHIVTVSAKDKAEKYLHKTKKVNILIMIYG